MLAIVLAVLIMPADYRPGCVCGGSCKCVPGGCPGTCGGRVTPGLPLPAPPVKKSPTIAPAAGTGGGVVKTPPPGRSPSTDATRGTETPIPPPGYHLESVNGSPWFVKDGWTYRDGAFHPTTLSIPQVMPAFGTGSCPTGNCPLKK